MPTVETPALSLHYREAGDPDGSPVLLVHGWPDAAVGWQPLVDRLDGTGLRLIVPDNRGSGGTRFRTADTPRDGTAVALTADVLDLADALGLDRFAVVGHDWGARTAYGLAALAPDRVERVVALALGYQPGGRFAVPERFGQSRNFWYQWLMCFPAGADSIAADPVGFARLQWETWSPSGWWTEQDFAVTAETFGPDWLAVTLSNYRSRYLPDEPRDPRYDPLRERLAGVEFLRTPTLMIQGGDDRCDPPVESEGLEPHFADYRRVVLDGVGHFPHREAPDTVAGLVRDHLAA
ncbi:pimeloyl-ACP methyl ester carboxylesterase [Friedmanniella endophytica]|uniref:Pimeloyl-ACP methyl ester carboxylesterase n=1 Tax=Microlunatus kandeliicorticis TaxID=1759536 RepID=A0A7W3ITC4_9ACTN|nr:alpha/beta hydrolase [Microlunatus kandeliicorticis]MBA8794800.1 pimeloyl-ACP methyl ester carboxylesterase [Microlunatus kandeliicorticis]